MPGPHRQLNMGLLINVPTLDAEDGPISSSASAAHSMLREALLLSVRPSPAPSCSPLLSLEPLKGDSEPCSICGKWCEQIFAVLTACLQVREVVQASTLADHEQLYHSVQCMLLDENRSLAAALPVLEVCHVRSTALISSI